MVVFLLLHCKQKRLHKVLIVSLLFFLKICTLIRMSTLKNRRIIFLARSALQVREWEKKNLPNANGELALDLFLLICYHTLIDKPLTFKTLFCSLDFSESGVRKHIRELKKNQWIEIREIQKTKD